MACHIPGQALKHSHWSPLLRRGSTAIIIPPRSLTVVILACAIWMLVAFGFPRGTKRANGFGPDPLFAA
jgi:uncharacterized membrane protein YhaH (DUF805 family)